MALAAALRLPCVDDMEYKTDEHWSFVFTQVVDQGGPWPELGMPTSLGVRHPPGNAWVFVALAQLTDAHSPTELARACQLLTVASFALLAGFILVCVPPREREVWIWGLALAAVNPLAVLFHRKIWPPSLLPFFLVLVLLGWWYRGRRGGALGWGVAGMVLGLIHPAGLFLVAGMALWGMLFDRSGVRWRWWLGGTMACSPLYVGWLRHLVNHPEERIERGGYLMHVVELKFWTRWLTEPFGFSLHYSLGEDFSDFLRHPYIGGHPTYLMTLTHALLIGLAVWLLGRTWQRLWRDRAAWRERLVERNSPTGFTIGSVLWGFGLVLTLTGLPLYRHYMILAFPLMFVWLARLALRERAGRLLLTLLILAQLVVSVGFLHYVHVNPRPLRGDYGTPYRAQSVFPETSPASDRVRD